MWRICEMYNCLTMYTSGATAAILAMQVTRKYMLTRVVDHDGASEVSNRVSWRVTSRTQGAIILKKKKVSPDDHKRTDTRGWWKFRAWSFALVKDDERSCSSCYYHVELVANSSGLPRQWTMKCNRSVSGTTSGCSWWAAHYVCTRGHFHGQATGFMVAKEALIDSYT